MLTCLCDAYYGEVGIAATRVLEHAGCEVEFLAAQTCCGQPPFNAGDWDAARKVALRWEEIFAGEAPVVCPSGSCAAMARDGFAQLLDRPPRAKVFELGEFLVRELRIERWPLTFAPPPLRRPRIAFHGACHLRGLGLKDEQAALLQLTDRYEIVDFGEPEQCCGFGGAFSINHPTISARIGDEKLRHVAETGCQVLVSGDMGCLMHLDGLIRRQGLDLRVAHFAELMAEAIPAGVPA